MTQPQPPGSGGPPEREPGLSDLGLSSTEVFSRQKPVSHRAHAADVPILGRFVAPLTAIVVVVVVIVLLIVINSHHSPNGGAAAAGVPSHSPSPSPSPSLSVVPRTTPATPPTHPSAAGHPTTSTKISLAPKPVTSKTAPAASATAMAPVQVLNNSRRTGLAAAVASEVQAKGWTIALVGNFRGLVSVPTVYYTTGNRAAAKHLASEFGSIQRIEPAADLGISTTGITLVLTQSWAD